MASFNRVILMGNLTKDPEVRYIPSGTAVGDLTVAVSRRYKTAAGQEQEETCFVDVTVWGRQAETCGEYLRKGRPVLLEGRLKQDRWEKDGQKHSRLLVVADRVQFLGTGAPGGAAGGAQGGEFKDAAEPEAEPPANARTAPRPEPRPEARRETPPEGPDEAKAEDEDNLPF